MKPTFFSWLLWPLAGLYGLIMRLRNAAFSYGWRRIHRPAVPTISVGNLSTGGTGKTPVAEWLLAYLGSQGLRVAYLSRGYGRRTKGYLRVDPAQGGAAQFGDEALQVAQHFPRVPVAVCEDRVLGVQRLARDAGAELVILDDAMQHRRIGRNLEIVVIDAQRLPTRDWLLPMGRLREPRISLRRASLLLVNKLYDPARLPAVQAELARYDRPLVFARPVARHLQHWQTGQRIPLAQLAGQPVLLLAGIGNPAAFRRQVEDLGAEVLATHWYRDHRAYRPADLARLRAGLAAQPSAWAITTDKDLARLAGADWVAPFADLPLYGLGIELAFWGGEAQLRAALQPWRRGDSPA